MAIPILKFWRSYFQENPDEGLGSSYERVVLNQKIESICNRYNVKKVLEAPSFGFTGMSGINSLNLALRGKQVCIADHDPERLRFIRQVWQEVGQSFRAVYLKSYNELPFSDRAFDLSWNFSALWFVDNLENFLAELCRVTSRAIVLCVPNRAGAGYLSQKYLGRKDLKLYLKEAHIIPANFKKLMNQYGWRLVEQDFIDAPPWPDIGMHKEKFLKLFRLHWLLPKNGESKPPLTIMEYYRGNDPDFPQKMMQHFWFEKHAPWIVKRFWAHHRYFLFERSD
ncbi:MAG: hypothetical protein Kow0042_25370 [Calditrichia bacterium]